MSGFTGLFRRTGEAATAAEIEAMTEAVAHRGPDGRGTWRDGPVALGHRQLQTTPESIHDSLPRRDGNRIITMDARIDNRAELCEALELDDAPTVTDSELLLATYDAWGVECFEHVVGDFAVVVYDQERNRVVCARDATGIKPFYYALDDDLFAFGSEPKAVLSLPDVSAAVDDASVFAFLADEFDDPEATFFESVSRLPPGHAMTVTSDRVETWSYWSAEEVGELDLPSDEAYEQRFRELFTEAVRCRLRRPPGTKATSYLSGGIDSTSIACIAQSLLAPREQLRTLSATYEGYPEADESEYLQAALDAYDFDARVEDIGGTTPFPDLDRRLAHHDAPFYPSLFMLDFQFADEFQNRDVRIVLDGLGGDQTLYHRSYYLTDLFRRGRFVRLAAELDALAEIKSKSKRRLLFENVATPLAPWPVRRVWRLFFDDGDFADEYPILDAEAAIDSGFPERYLSDDRLPPTGHREDQRRKITDPEQNLFFEVKDVERARLGVEPRYPFFDRRLVEFCIALPADQKVRQGVGRQIVRRTLRGTLPEKIRTRNDKANFGESLIAGLQNEELDRIRDRLVDSPKYVVNYVDGDLRSTYRRFVEEPSYDDAWELDKAYAVESWLRSLGSS